MVVVVMLKSGTIESVKITSMVIIVVWIRSLLESYSSWKISHLKRKYNRVALELAKFAKCKGISQVQKGVAPPFVQHLLQSDYT